MPISEVHNQDCLTALKDYPDNFFELAVVDPPYGIDGNSHRKNKSRNKLTLAKDYHTALWDQEPPSEEYFKELFRVSKNQIIWGINYFTNSYEFTAGRIVWDKINGDNNFSDGEIAFCSFYDSVRIVRYMWNGMMQGYDIGRDASRQIAKKNLNEKRIHPTQKPVKLYEWLFIKYAKEGDKILDTHLGSGSSRIAAYKQGFDFYGFEIDQVHFKDQEKRFQKEKPDLDTFRNFEEQTTQEVEQLKIL